MKHVENHSLGATGFTCAPWCCCQLGLKAVDAGHCRALVLNGDGVVVGAGAMQPLRPGTAAAQRPAQRSASAVTIS